MRILIVEDERTLNSVISRQFKRLCYSVDSCFDGEDAVSFIGAADYDAVILDVMLPKIDGFEVLKKVRGEKNTVPVLMLTAKGELDDKVYGLDCGANDYLVKPFEFRELEARVRAMMRNVRRSPNEMYTVGDLCMDCSAKKVTRAGVEIRLSAKEYAVLECLMRNSGCILSRDAIENSVSNFEYSGSTNVIDVYIRYLRKKIDDNSDKKLIHTVRGMGYVLREE